MNALLLHGWAANHHVFDEIKVALPEYHCITPDLPGHGLCPFDGLFDLSKIAKQYADMLTEPTHILGWSMGGVIAMIMAAQYAHKVRTLTIISSFACYQYHTDYPIGFRQPYLHHAAEVFSGEFAQQMAAFLQLELLDNMQKKRLAEWVYKLTKYGTPTALQAAAQAVIDSDIRALLPSIHCPTLLVFGARDRMTPPSMGEYLHQHIARSVWHLLPKGTHMPFLAQAKTVIPLIKKHWQEF